MGVMKRALWVAAGFGALAIGVATFDGGSLVDAPAPAAPKISAESQAWVDGNPSPTEALIHSAARGGQFLTGEVELPTNPDAFDAAVMDVGAFCDTATLAGADVAADCLRFFVTLAHELADVQAGAVEAR